MILKSRRLELPGRKGGERRLELPGREGVEWRLEMEPWSPQLPEAVETGGRAEGQGSCRPPSVWGSSKKWTGALPWRSSG